MKKWKGSMGVKVCAWIGVTISAVLFIGSAIGTIFIWDLGLYDYSSEGECREALYENAARGYSLEALSNLVNGTESDFSKTGFRYGILKAESLEGIDLTDKNLYLEHNFTDRMMPEELYITSYEVGSTGEIAMQDETWRNDTGGNGTSAEGLFTEEVINYPIYNPADGIFYYETRGTYYPAREVSVYGKADGETELYHFLFDFDKRMYHYIGKEIVQESGGGGEAAAAGEMAAEMAETAWTGQVAVDADIEALLGGAEYLNFQLFLEFGVTLENHSVILDGREYVCDGSDILIADMDIGAEVDGVIAKSRNYTVDAANSTIYTAKEMTDTYWVVTEFPKTLEHSMRDDLFAQANFAAVYGYGLRYGVYAIMLCSVGLGLLCMILLIKAAGHRRGTDEIVLTWADRIPFDLFLGAILFLVVPIFVFGINVVSYWGTLLGLIMLGGLCVFASWVLLFIILSFSVRIKCGKWWQNTLTWWVTSRFYRFVREIFRNISLLWKVLLVLGILSLLEFWVVSWDGIGRITMCWFVEKMILIPLILAAVLQMQKLKSAAQRMAEGDLEHRVDTEKMFWEFQKHGEALNSISSGMLRAVDERMKSERFKTELITNVSHDIKTPLTSIINYVDLLEKEKLNNETAEEYLEVLERQSARLKKLIEDLMEASKASTGNLEVHLEALEAGVSLIQIVGEFDEKMSAAKLKLLIDKPQNPVYILADSRHFWRVIDNLMNNICKYAQPGTRVYINLERMEDMARLTFRNTSKYPLNISSEELMERFVRGDSSRNTEGSGLGLSIAKSLMDLMKGRFSLYVDGDLFKVVLEFPEADEELPIEVDME